MAIKTCKACEKLFEGTGTASYCSGPHYAICEVCGKQFECDPRIHNRCCSAKCKAELRKQTIRKTERVCKLCGKILHQIRILSNTVIILIILIVLYAEKSLQFLKDWNMIRRELVL